MIIRQVEPGWGPYVEALKCLKKKLEDAEHFKDTIWYQKNYGKMIRRRDRLRAVVPAKYDPFGED